MFDISDMFSLSLEKSLRTLWKYHFLSVAQAFETRARLLFRWRRLQRSKFCLDLDTRHKRNTELQNFFKLLLMSSFEHLLLIVFILLFLREIQHTVKYCELVWTQKHRVSWWPVQFGCSCLPETATCFSSLESYTHIQYLHTLTHQYTTCRDNKCRHFAEMKPGK